MRKNRDPKVPGTLRLTASRKMIAGRSAVRSGQAGPFDSLAKCARSLTVPALEAKKGREKRDPLWCPEQDLNLHVLANTSS